MWYASIKNRRTEEDWGWSSTTFFMYPHLWAGSNYQPMKVYGLGPVLQQLTRESTFLF